VAELANHVTLAALNTILLLEERAVKGVFQEVKGQWVEILGHELAYGCQEWS
jgi:hypothetical protein